MPRIGCGQLTGYGRGQASEVEQSVKCLPEGLTSRLVETGARGQAKADSVLFSAGEPGDGLYFIEAGLLKVVMESPGGEESVCQSAWLGESSPANSP